MSCYQHMIKHNQRFPLIFLLYFFKSLEPQKQRINKDLRRRLLSERDETNEKHEKQKEEE